VQVLSNGYTVARKKLLFPIVCHQLLNQDQRSFESPTLKGSKKVGKGEVYVELRLKKRGFVPGEPICGDIIIDNKSDKSVKYSHFCICQKTLCYSLRPEVQTHESSFETDGMGLPIHKVVAGQRFEYPITFYVPALVPNLNVPECIEVEYEARLDVGKVRGSAKSAFITLSTPIYIGTHPATDQDLISVLGFNGALRNRSQPPPAAYENLSFLDSTSLLDFSSCSASVGGLSAVEGDDSQPIGYTPLYYEYNYQNLHAGIKSEETRKMVVPKFSNQ
uniref:Arrestin C-terminal-like domain-containing protein n=1 Tax=Acrobeloides nanus TaxID=290746 RepID=A0A914BY86_9BILA